MIPTIGRIVQYTLSSMDAAQIGTSRGVSGPQVGSAKGNRVAAGDVYPMMITRVWGKTPESAVNGQVLLDGNDTLWVTSVTCGEGERHFAWPVREA